MPNFSLTRNAQGDLPVDGFAAPRFVHWLVKVATGAAFTLPAWWLGGIWWALIAAVGSFIVTKSFAIEWIGLRSIWIYKGPRPLTLDFAFDFTLNLLPWLALAHVGWPVWVAATVLLGVLYPFASP